MIPFPTSGVALMLFASGFFSIMFMLVKSLGPEFPYFEAVLFRALFGLPAVTVLVYRSDSHWVPKQLGWMLLRGVFGFIAMVCYFFALGRGKLANIAAIGRVQPFLMTVLAPLFINEQASRRVWLTLLLGFSGALLVIKPGFGIFNLPGVIALVAALSSALAHLIVNRLSKTESPQLIVLFFTIIVGLGGGLMSIPVFVVPNERQLLTLLGIACCSTCGQLLMTMAYARDRVPIVAAASYSTVAYSVVLGLLIWGEIPDYWALLGGAMIVFAGVLLAFFKKEPPPPPSAQ